MQWLQDKKNLPIVIGLVVLIVAGAGFFLYKQITAGSGSAPADSQMADQSTPAPSAPAAPAAGTPGAPGSTTAAPPAGAATTPAAGPAGQTPAAPGTGTANASTAVASDAPGERWRVDPFAPQTTARKAEPKPKLRIPTLARIFPAEKKEVAKIKYVTPQPPRRVAGILYGDKVNALIQTVNGWEIKRPGEKLSDGSIVERIERDRVIIRTVSGNPKFVEIKLAASLSQLPSSTPSQSSANRNNRRAPTGGTTIPSRL